MNGFLAAKTNSPAWLRRWSLRILLVSGLIVVLCTLYPFNFAFGKGNPLQQIVAGFSNRTSTQDLLANVILFMPFGFGVAGFFQTTHLRPRSKLVLVILTSMLLSVAVEISQVFLPTRTAAYTDLITNAIGGTLGWLFFEVGGIRCLTAVSRLTQSVRQFTDKLSIQHLTAAFLSYLVLSFSIAAAQQLNTLRLWNVEYPIILGDSRLSPPAWQGQLADVLLADRAVSSQEAATLLTGKIETVFQPPSVVAFYPLQGRNAYQDQTRQNPNLEWQGQPPATQPVIPTFKANQWLQTDGAATQMLQRLRQTSEFTFSATVTPTAANANFFAKFFSIGTDSDHHNLSIGQAGTVWLFWIQTSQTGKRHGVPNSSMGGIFTPGSPQKLVITYKRSVVRLYTAATLPPFEFNLIPISDKVISLGLIFAPLGLLLALIAKRLRGRVLFYLLLIGNGIVLPPCILESILAIQSGRSVNRSNLLLGLLIMGGALLSFQARPSIQEHAPDGKEKI